MADWPWGPIVGTIAAGVIFAAIGWLIRDVGGDLD